MSLIIGKAIFSILSGDTGVSSYVGNKIYPIFAPDEVQVPFLVFQRNSVVAYYTKDGLTYDDVVVGINIVSDNYTECINVAEAVRSALELKVGIFNGVSIYQVLLSSSTEDFGIDGFITYLEFQIKCK